VAVAAVVAVAVAVAEPKRQILPDHRQKKAPSNARGFLVAEAKTQPSFSGAASAFFSHDSQPLSDAPVAFM